MSYTNPEDIVRIERVRGRGPLRMQMVAVHDFTYRVSTLADGDRTMQTVDLRPIMQEVARAQEPGANKMRIAELVHRMIDRSWNMPVLYLNRRTGEVTT